MTTVILQVQAITITVSMSDVGDRNGKVAEDDDEDAIDVQTTTTTMEMASHGER